MFPPLIHGRTKLLLLAGVSAFAIFGTTARSEEIPAGSFWLELAGSGPFWHASRGENYFVGTSETKPKHGLTVSGEIGYRFSESPWSVTMRIGHGFSKRRTEAFNTSGIIYGTTASFIGAADDREKLTFLDFEIGRDVGFGISGTKLRMHAGLRFADFRSKETGIGTVAYGTSAWPVTTLVKRKFSGIGPRIGISSLTPLNDSLSLRLDAAGALLFGKRKYHASVYYSGFPTPFTVDRSRTKAIPNISAYAGFAWTPASMPGMTVSLGYSVDAYFGIAEAWHVSGYGKSDRIIHGPKLSIRFDF